VGDRPQDRAPNPRAGFQRPSAEDARRPALPRRGAEPGAPALAGGVRGVSRTTSRGLSEARSDRLAEDEAEGDDQGRRNRSLDRRRWSLGHRGPRPTADPVVKLPHDCVKPGLPWPRVTSAQTDGGNAGRAPCRRPSFSARPRHSSRSLAKRRERHFSYRVLRSGRRGDWRRWPEPSSSLHFPTGAGSAPDCLLRPTGTDAAHRVRTARGRGACEDRFRGSRFDNSDDQRRPGDPARPMNHWIEGLQSSWAADRGLSSTARGRPCSSKSSTLA
jgi:hypothetical protein